ncbi:MAG: hypothetical protein B6D72_11875 [gamma proteobacterium symbiont of Ctena orbiculata]|uniref:Uncharacterized protein n=1 Tax=Candidatus Thiodiazotropha taylori TaxID=2792791 RepID=A0A944M5Y5_9GAMM|nr:hypothetical protein [Candidatus Thiodiazotropha taylori]PUB86701.1 MAG: hypothetical protein DBP00_11375 [gamma proteobacterium symbiont of Ctena orbiculata]MBT2987790.1 hypothetical protein [Candidatus Thiodiazotropha taylori]MBT2995823.1 hypothetical protein [Candidatus Thiodiazotropha taylori]MBT2999138.1 hypothetical protein [Candidatus Thiodiazotropha taylori]
MYTIDMKRLHQGCGESLQSKLSGFSIFRSSLIADVAVGQRQFSKAVRREEKSRREESDFR